MKKKYKLKQVMFMSLLGFYLLIFIFAIAIITFATQQTLTSYTTDIRLEMLHKNQQNLEYRLEQVEEIGLLIYTNALLGEMIYNEADYSYNSLQLSYEFNEFIGRFLYIKPDIEHINIYCDRLVGYPDDEQYIKPLSEIKWQEKLPLMNEQNFMWISTNDLNNESTLSYAMKFEYSSYIGYVEIILDQQIFSSYIDSELYDKNASSAIISLNEQGEVMSQTFTDIELQNAYIPQTDLPNSNGFIEKNINGQKYLILYSNASGGSWRLIELFPHNEIYERVNDVLNIVIMYIVFTFASLIPLFAWIINLITKPIKHITDDITGNDISNLINTKRRHKIEEFDKLFLSFTAMNKNLRQSINDLHNEQQKKREAEISALQSQINPHFFYNTLDMLNWMAISKGCEDISLVIVRLSRLFRISLSKGSNIIPLKKEVEHSRLYLQIQQTKFRRNFIYEENISDEIMEYYVPKICIQPFVENSIIHGFSNVNIEKPTIKISAKLTGNKSFDLIIEDNGKGLDKNKAKDTGNDSYNGYGIDNVDKRIKLFFGNQYGININNKENGGVIVKLSFPIIDKQSKITHSEEI